MEFFKPLILLIVGFVILIKGADWFVDGAAALAERFGISQLVIGLTVVAMGTSAPEAAVSITSALAGNAGITIGNVLGSNIMNILLILGITAVITSVPVKKVSMKREIPFMIAITVVLGAFGLIAGRISLLMGIVFWALFTGYLVYLFRVSGSEDYLAVADAGDGPEGSDDENRKSFGMLLLFGVIGCAGIILGSDLTVDSAAELASIFGMSQRLIGLTIIAFGTSLPELVTSVAAALKNNADLAVGNIVGSNIFNILFVTGTTALIIPVDFEIRFVLDAAVAAIAGIILLAAPAGKGSLRRPAGIFMLAFYAAYFIYITMGA